MGIFLRESVNENHVRLQYAVHLVILVNEWFHELKLQIGLWLHFLLQLIFFRLKIIRSESYICLLLI